MNESHHRQRLPRVVRIIRARPRLFLSALIGVAIIAVLPADWRLATRLLVGWDAGLALYLAAVYAMIARADISRIRARTSGSLPRGMVPSMQ